MTILSEITFSAFLRCIYIYKSWSNEALKKNYLINFMKKTKKIEYNVGLTKPLKCSLSDKKWFKLDLKLPYVLKKIFFIFFSTKTSLGNP